MTNAPPAQTTHTAANHTLTNRTAATRLRALLQQATTEEPSLSTRLIQRLTPTAEERWLQRLPCPTNPTNPGTAP
jgi:hypothetical protein